MMVEQWRMVSPNEKWFNHTEYCLRIHLVRVTEQNDIFCHDYGKMIIWRLMRMKWLAYLN
jgi:hypothetical protein